MKQEILFIFLYSWLKKMRTTFSVLYEEDFHSFWLSAFYLKLYGFSRVVPNFSISKSGSAFQVAIRNVKWQQVYRELVWLCQAFHCRCRCFRFFFYIIMTLFWLGLHLIHCNLPSLQRTCAGMRKVNYTAPCRNMKPHFYISKYRYQ